MPVPSPIAANRHTSPLASCISCASFFFFPWSSRAAPASHPCRRSTPWHAWQNSAANPRSGATARGALWHGSGQSAHAGRALDSSCAEEPSIHEQRRGNPCRDADAQGGETHSEREGRGCVARQDTECRHDDPRAARCAPSQCSPCHAVTRHCASHERTSHRDPRRTWTCCSSRCLARTSLGAAPSRVTRAPFRRLAPKARRRALSVRSSASMPPDVNFFFVSVSVRILTSQSSCHVPRIPMQVP